LRARRRRVPVGTFDVASKRWTNVDGLSAAARDELTVATFNVWFSDFHAEARYRAIADVMSRNMPDVMVFQEVTPIALAIFLDQPWVRVRYRRAEVTGGDRGNYGMLLLSRLPINDVTYTRLPTNLARGFLTAELDTGGSTLTVVAAHLESGKGAARLRARQLGRIFGSLRRAENAFVLGDFNMRDSENDRIAKGYRDLWPALRPHDDGFTEDTTINLMRLDSKNKQRQVRFDRILLKGDGWAATSIDLLGTEPISEALPRVFPSDHFGVLCRLERLAKTKDVGHQRLWPAWRR
jgi:tyrosyl-DNA phosphodiesterase 2